MKKLDELMLKANDPQASEEDRREAAFEAFRIKETALQVAVAAMTEVTKRTAAVDGDAMQEALDVVKKIEEEGIPKA